jgi:hypothetical protein
MFKNQNPIVVPLRCPNGVVDAPVGPPPGAAPAAAGVTDTAKWCGAATDRLRWRDPGNNPAAESPAGPEYCLHKKEKSSKNRNHGFFQQKTNNKTYDTLGAMMGGGMDSKVGSEDVNSSAFMAADSRIIADRGEI